MHCPASPPKQTFILAGLATLVMERVLGAAVTELSWDTKSPEVTLFKVLKTSWDDLNLTGINLPSIPAMCRKETELYQRTT